MVKVGRLITPYQQLCYAHGIQLAIVDVIYKESCSLSETQNTETSMKNEAVDVDSDSEGEEDSSFNLTFPVRESELNVEYGAVIKKLRKIVKLFKNSPTKNDVLQTYILTDVENNTSSLSLDCKTRCSSLIEMIKKFNKVKLCVCKALVDFGFGANPEYLFTEQEYDVLLDLEQILHPLKVAVEVLCRRDSDLITAEKTLSYFQNNM
ncbi:hypothetical protein O0L34_g19209 [Tuta absoluta]|nr:hypothetical protein O0L34_g19209 [Tuta absoluta]